MGSNDIERCVSVYLVYVYVRKPRKAECLFPHVVGQSNPASSDITQIYVAKTTKLSGVDHATPVHKEPKLAPARVLCTSTLRYSKWS